MVSQHAMATTVRKVKQENRLRRQNQSQDEEGPYKPVPPPKPVSNNQKNNQDGQQDEQREQTVVERSSLRTTSGPERTSVAENGQVRSAAGQPFAPEYRMPPLYGEEQSSGQAQQAASLQTHSSKFPVRLLSGEL
ncbi:mediator of rna polymerase ii transcription subunit 12-like isoform x3 protein [Lasius niger]|uniref:Mediator of rna polymerase ii transcription subunit 12-like isoform x3 protein n=1 Tax=Lasius niger TaxID=67767 RepID=A0A0J7KQM3_LASNI|nr:mediator of rna polymerase ii transcription subunit 12-like isoform x3 protein [Lasius niger]